MATDTTDIDAGEHFELEADTDDLFDVETPPPAGSPTPADDVQRPAAKPRGSRRNVPLRRAVERTVKIASLDHATQGVLAAALDVAAPSSAESSLVDLAVAAIDDPGLARATLSTIVELLSVDDLEAGVIATGVFADRSASRRLWAVIRHLDPSLPASSPSRAVQAGLSVGRSARALSDAERKRLHRALEVLR